MNVQEDKNGGIDNEKNTGNNIFCYHHSSRL